MQLSFLSYLMHIRTITALCTAFVTLTLVSSRASEAPAKSPSANNTIVLDEIGVKNLRIETAPLEEQDFEETAFTLGNIEAVPRNIATLSSRIPGRIIELKVAPGDIVEAGTVIAKVESRQPGDPPPVIPLKATISGMVTRLDVRLGDPVEPDKVLLEITDLREVYAVARVPEYLAGRLKPSMSAVNTGTPVSTSPTNTPFKPGSENVSVARITIATLPKEKFTGTLLRFGTSADKASGTLDAIFRLANPEGLLRSGMRAEFAIVLSHRKNVMSVPKASLQGEASSRFVYVKDFGLPNAFVKTPVVVGEVNDRYVEIISGVLPADEVVTRGAYSLGSVGAGSVSLKEALDAAHGHEHAADGGELTPEKVAEMKAKKAAQAKPGEKPTQGATDGESSPFWMYTSVVLFVLLLISLAFRGGSGPQEDKETPVSPHESPHGESPADITVRDEADESTSSEKVEVRHKRSAGLTRSGGGH